MGRFLGFRITTHPTSRRSRQNIAGYSESRQSGRERPKIVVRHLPLNFPARAVGGERMPAWEMLKQKTFHCKIQDLGAPDLLWYDFEPSILFFKGMKCFSLLSWVPHQEKWCEDIVCKNWETFTACKEFSMARTSDCNIHWWITWLRLRPLSCTRLQRRRYVENLRTPLHIDINDDDGDEDGMLNTVLRSLTSIQTCRRCTGYMNLRLVYCRKCKFSNRVAINFLIIISCQFFDDNSMSIFW